jgi:type I restriction enzyme S subunit
MTTFTAMPKYEVYKDSGVEWIGEIPKEWSTRKVKYLFRIGRGRVISQQELDDNGCYPVYSSQTQNDGILGYISTFDFDCEQITWTTDGANAGTVFLRKGKHNCTNVCGTLQPISKQKISLEFLKNALSIAAQFYKRPDTNGAKIMNGEMAEIFVTFPPLEAQTAIANFLDEKTAKIDEAIAIKEKQIELLKERKQIIIQLAVTQGLDLTVPMKDSGVEWIGKIPAHWEVKKIKYFIDILPGYAFKSELYSTNPSDLKLLRGINVSPDKIKWDEVAYWSKEKMAGLENFILKKGDLVIAMDRPWISTGIRVAEIAESDLPCLLLQRVGRIRGINHFSTKYIKLLLSTELFLSYFEPMLTGISVPHISTEQISGFCCPIPPEDEQNKILEHIDLESKQFDRIISLLNIEIEKLNEYKTTLINSAVTGKIKVV